MFMRPAYGGRGVDLKARPRGSKLGDAACKRQLWCGCNRCSGDIPLAQGSSGLPAAELSQSGNIVVEKHHWAAIADLNFRARGFMTSVDDVADPAVAAGPA